MRSRLLERGLHGERAVYDVVFDAVGKHSFQEMPRLAEGRRYLPRDRSRVHVARPAPRAATRWIGDKKVMLPIPKYTKDDVLYAKRLIEAGQYRPVIDRTYPLEDVVEATRYVEAGHKTGNVVLTLNGTRR